MPTAVSLFTGCGGSDAGLVSLGFDVLLANDILPYARDVYLHNHPETDYRLGDVAKIKNFPKAELLVGCYPCQGFSQGGARLANRNINYLYLEFLRALQQIQPKAFIVENVSGMIRSTYRHLLDDQISKFSAAGKHGYHVQPAVLNAQDFGVAQERKRIIIVGIRKDLGVEYEFPFATHGEHGKKGLVTIKDALSGLPEWPTGEFCEDPFHWYYMSRNRRRDWSETSKTIVSHMRHMPLHPMSPALKRIHTDKWIFESNEAARRFSYREAARLQGFGKKFSFPETDAASLAMKYRVVGNAVPPPLFKAVANALPDVWS